MRSIICVLAFTLLTGCVGGAFEDGPYAYEDDAAEYAPEVVEL